MSRPRNLVLGAALVLALVLAYARSLPGDFLWDDDLHITANPVIVGPLGLKEIWTTERANYFPLVLTNFKVQHALWELNPVGYRVVTLLFHAGAALLLWRVLGQLRVPGAWFGAALWALHPVQVESVAWICELKNTQSAVFFLAAIACWIRFVSEAEPGSRRRTSYGLALGCALLAILSKPSTVMLPVALALCTWWLGGRLRGRDAVALVPFLALSALAAGWTIWEQKHHSGAIGEEWSQSWLERSVIAGRAVWFYLGQLAWPQSLSFIYPRWTIEAGRLAAYGGLIGLFGVAVLLFRARHAAWARSIGFAAVYFVALLFPVLGFFDVYFFRYSFVGDHFQYLASMGPLALAAAGVVRVLPVAGPRVAAVGVASLAVLTARQAGDYRSSETLWRATVMRNESSAMAWTQLGSVLGKNARPTEAVACFHRALRLNPRHPEALNHLGTEYLRAGRTDDAVRELRRAIEARPDFAEAESNLGVALLHAGRAEEALQHVTLALRRRPEAFEPLYNRARVLNALGRTEEAIAHGEAALRIAPNRAELHDELGLALAAAGRLEVAMAEHRRAIELNPGLADAHNNLGVALARSGRLPEALEAFDAAVQRAPDDAAARVNRGGARARLGRLAEAREDFARVVELQPDSAAVHAYLGQVLQLLGRETEARPHLERAEQLQRAMP